LEALLADKAIEEWCLYGWKRKLSSAFVAIFFLANFSLFAEPNFPSLKDDKEKVGFLLGVQDYIPTLFSYNDGQGAEFFEVIENQLALKELLSQNADFNKLMRTRGPDLTISIAPEALAEKTLHHERVGRWKEEWLRILQELPQTESVHSALLAKLKSAVQTSGKGTSGGMLSGLIQTLPKTKQQEIFRLPFSEKISALKENLPPRLSENGFRAEAYGLSPDLTSKEALDELQKKAGAETEASQILTLITALGDARLRGPTGSKKPQEFVPIVNGLSAADFTPLLQPSGIRRQISQLAHNASQKDGISLPQNLLSSTESDLRELVVHAPSEPGGQGGRLILRELPQWVGGFRGCIGRDCSTTYSSGYALSPIERIFVIYGSNGDPKGYIHAQVVEADKKKTLFAHTITGPKLSQRDTHQILQALYESRGALGVEQIGLDVTNNGKIGNNEVIAVINSQLAQEKARTLFHIDEAVRPLIDNTSTQPYDKLGKNYQLYLYEPQAKDKISQSVAVQAAPSPEYQPREVTQADALLLAYAFKVANKNNASQKTLDAMNLRGYELSLFQNVLTNPNRIPIQLYYGQLKEFIAERGVADPEAYLKRYEDYLWEGHLRASDAMMPEHQKQSVQLALNLFSQDSRSFEAARLAYEAAPELFEKNERLKNIIRRKLRETPDKNWVNLSHAFFGNNSKSLVTDILVDMLTSEDKSDSARAQELISSTPYNASYGSIGDAFLNLMRDPARLSQLSPDRLSEIVSLITSKTTTTQRVHRNGFYQNIQSPSAFQTQLENMLFLPSHARLATLLLASQTEKKRSNLFPELKDAILNGAPHERRLAGEWISDHSGYASEQELLGEFPNLPSETREALVPLVLNKSAHPGLILSELLTDKDPALRRASLLYKPLNTYFPDVAILWSKLEPFLRDPELEVRLAALEAARKLENPVHGDHAMELFQKFLQDEAPEARVGALKGLANFPGTEAQILPLLDFLSREKNQEVIQEVHGLLAKIPNVSSQSNQIKLSEVLLGKDKASAEQAAKLLSRSPITSNTVIDKITAALLSENETTQFHGIRALPSSLIARFRIQDALARQLQSKSSVLQKEAAESLLQANDLAPSVAKTLVSLLKHPDKQLSLLGERAVLLASTPPESLLTILADAPTPGTRATAARKLIQNTPAEKTIHLALGKAIQDPSPEVRQAAVESLYQGKWVSPEIRRLVLPALTDEDPNVRDAVLTQLEARRELPVDFQIAVAKILIANTPWDQTKNRAIQILRAQKDPSPKIYDEIFSGVTKLKDLSNLSTFLYLNPDWSTSKERLIAFLLKTNPSLSTNLVTKLCSQAKLTPFSERVLVGILPANQSHARMVAEYFKKNPPEDLSVQKALSKSILELQSTAKGELLSAMNRWPSMNRNLQRSLLVSLYDSDADRRMESLLALAQVETPLAAVKKALRTRLSNLSDFYQAVLGLQTHNAGRLSPDFQDIVIERFLEIPMNRADRPALLTALGLSLQGSAKLSPRLIQGGLQALKAGVVSDAGDPLLQAIGKHADEKTQKEILSLLELGYPKLSLATSLAQARNLTKESRMTVNKWLLELFPDEGDAKQKSERTKLEAILNQVPLCENPLEKLSN
jgi:HEAT repeat protein